MLRTLKLLSGLIVLLLLVVVLAVGGALIGLNTGAGRHFAEQKINHFAGPRIVISGLGGHFPADIKLASVSVADAQGVWLTGQALELRWQPRAVLRRNLHITALTASRLDIARQPVAATASSPGGGSFAPPLTLDVDYIAVPALELGTSLAGQAATLGVTGAAHLQSLTQGRASIDAATPDGLSTYHLATAMNAKNLSMTLHAAEPPDGLLGHFAGPRMRGKLRLDVSLAGPRDKAALDFHAALGAARLDGGGTLALPPAAPSANLLLTVPDLAPFGAIAGQNIAGSTKLHLRAARQPDGSVTLALDGDVALTAAPFGAARYVGPKGHLVLRASLQDRTVNIQQLDLSGASFTAAATGSVAQTGFNLETHIGLPRVQDFSPGLSGTLTEDGTLAGTAQDFAVNALLTGDILQKNIPSGPFSLSINAQHLPRLPTGTLTGSGALENAPLLLDAAFSRDTSGATTLVIYNALWRSLNATADLALAPGADLPTGTATFKLGNLADFQTFSPVPLRGSVNGDFAHLAGQIFKLDLDARNLLVAPQLGTVNTTIHALGPTKALAVQAQATVAKLISAPARVALAGILDIDNRSATLSSLSASWRRIDTQLQGPAEIATQPGIVVRHLALGLNGGRIGLDGTLTPRLNATLTVQNLPAATANLFEPSLNVTGTVSATATITGTRNAPNGKLTLNARALKLHSGPVATLPPADLTGSATVTGQSATIDTHLTAGPDISLAANGLVPLNQTGAMNLRVRGRTDLRLLDLFLAAGGSAVHGLVTADMTLTGTPAAPRANGSMMLEDGSVENIASGLNLTRIGARIDAAGRMVTLQNLTATAGAGQITGHGTVDLGAPSIPLNVTIDATNATPISSDIVHETLDASLHISGAVRGKMALGGTVKIRAANINIPKSLPPSVANLPIVYAGQKPPTPPTPPPPVALDLTITAENRIFVRGDGLFAELSGHLHIGGTAGNPVPEGGFELIRGNFSLAGTTLQFTRGQVGFNGAGFMPTLDLEASSVTTNNNTATLIVGGTAAKPSITLTSSPPLPSDEILAQLLFGQSTANLTAFQAASLAAALAQLSGVGSGLNPLDRVRNALGLDELSLGGSGSGPPSVQAGRYVAPGVYVGASQATNGQGTQANVQVNLYKGLKLNTSTGTSSTGAGDASSVGLTYQFNY